MSKRFKYFISVLFSALGFFMFVNLPYESRYYGLMAGVVLVTFCFWFGLGILFDKSFYTRIMSVLLPVCFFVGFGMFVAFLPNNFWWELVLTLFFALVLYTMFLVENVFLVAIGFKTVPLYRAAYTVSLIMLLLTAFFMFNSLFSFRMTFWGNTIGVLLISVLLFFYQYWAIAIELSDDGKDKPIKSYVLVPSILVAELAMIFSFWPTGIFKGSMYLVSVIYIISGLIQADIRSRLFKRTWLAHAWISVAVILAILAVTSWR